MGVEVAGPVRETTPLVGWLMLLGGCGDADQAGGCEQRGKASPHSASVPWFLADDLEGRHMWQPGSGDCLQGSIVYTQIMRSRVVHRPG